MTPRAAFGVTPQGGNACRPGDPDPRHSGLKARAADRYRDAKVFLWPFLANKHGMSRQTQ